VASALSSPSGEYHLRLIRVLNLTEYNHSHGLSYTTFELTSLHVKKEDEASFIATATVKNTGAVKGSEVVQIYVAYPNIGVTTPTLQLRAFNKAIDLEPESSTELKLHLDRLAFSFWDEVKGSWCVHAGTYGIYTGRNSDDLHKVTEVEIEKTFHWMDL
jgi:beta-glucosidase